MKSQRKREVCLLFCFLMSGCTGSFKLIERIPASDAQTTQSALQSDLQASSSSPRPSSQQEALQPEESLPSDISSSQAASDVQPDLSNASEQDRSSLQEDESQKKTEETPPDNPQPQPPALRKVSKKAWLAQDGRLYDKMSLGGLGKLVKKGSGLTVVGISDEMGLAKVQMEDGQSGWMALSQITYQKPQKPASLPSASSSPSSPAGTPDEPAPPAPPKKDPSPAQREPAPAPSSPSSSAKAIEFRPKEADPRTGRTWDYVVGGQKFVKVSIKALCIRQTPVGNTPQEVTGFAQSADQVGFMKEGQSVVVNAVGDQGWARIEWPNAQAAYVPLKVLKKR